jgi:adenosine deaminase
MKPNALRQFIANVPKTETHLHIEGALPWELLERIDPKVFSQTPYFRKSEFRYKSFEQFESILIEHAMRWFHSAESYFEAAGLIFNKHVQQNVKYVEISFHAGMIEFLKLPGKEILQAILDAVPSGLDVRVFLGISRNAYTSYLGPLLEEALHWDELYGIDLHGLESLPMESWTVPFWERARSAGKVVKAHAGEFGPASNVRHAVTEMKVKRIQHGTRSVEDKGVMQLLVDEDITLDVCPISNYKLRVIGNWSEHPIKLFIKNGIRCTISTDDPLSFNNSIIDEYVILHEKLSLRIPELADLIINGFEVADLPEEKKSNLIENVNKQVNQISSIDV